MDLTKLLSRLANLDTAGLADTNKELRVFDLVIRPARPGLMRVGVASPRHMSLPLTQKSVY